MTHGGLVRVYRVISGKVGYDIKQSETTLPAAIEHISPNPPLPNSSFPPSIMSCIPIAAPGTYSCPTSFRTDFCVFFV